MPKSVLNFFGAEQNKITGAFFAGGTLYVTALERTAEGWSIVRCIKNGQRDWISGEDTENVAARLSECCLKNGLSTRNVVLCLPADGVFSYEKEFPEIPSGPDKFLNMLFWDLEINVPYDEGSYWYGGMPLDDGGRCFLAAIEKSRGEAELARFAENEIKLTGLCVEQPDYAYEVGDGCLLFNNERYSFKTPETGMEVWEHGSLTALFAAASLNTAYGLNLLPAGEKRQDGFWNMLTVLSVLFTFVFLLSLWAGNLWQISRVDSRISGHQEQLVLLQGERERMRKIAGHKKEYDDGNAVLADLTKRRYSLYTVLTWLGEAVVDEVYLTGLESNSGGELVLKGKALNYENVSGYLEMLKAETGLCREGPYLENSEINDKGEVTFVLKGKL